MNHRPTRNTVLPVHRVLVGTPSARPTLTDWAAAGEVAAADDLDAAAQAAAYLVLPTFLWVRDPHGKTTGVHVAAQERAEVGR